MPDSLETLPAFLTLHMVLLDVSFVESEMQLPSTLILALLLLLVYSSHEKLAARKVEAVSFLLGCSMRLSCDVVASYCC